MSGDPMTPARDIRDRVAEALRVFQHPLADKWESIPERHRENWRIQADGFIAYAAALNLSIVEKPHG